MTRRDQVQRGFAWIQQPGHQGDKLFRRQVLVQVLIQVSEEAPQISFRGKAGASIRATASHTDGGANPVTGYIGNRDCDAPVRQLLPVEIVSTGLIGRVIPP